MAAGDERNEGLAEIPYVMAAPSTATSCAESIYEYGSRAGIWRLLRLFDEYEVKTTFFAAAIALERNPEVGQWIQESRPRALQPRLALGGALAARPRGGAAAHPVGDRVDRADDAASARSGWYCRYGPSVNTRELLVEEGGFVYDSDAYNDDLPYFTEVKGKRHLVVPYSFVYNDGRFVLPQGFGWPRPTSSTSAGARLDELRREGPPGTRR